MALISELMGLGTPPRNALQIGMAPVSVSAVGTTQATAGSLQLGSHLFVVTATAAANGVIFSSNTGQANVNIVAVASASTTATIYCPVSGSMNGTTNGSVLVNPAKACLFVATGVNAWVAVNSA